MATDPLVGATGVIVLQGAAAAVIGASPLVSPFALHFSDYGAASFFAVIGIVARHAFESSQRRRFDMKAFAFDLPTAPMLGILGYVGAVYMQFADYVIPCIVIVVGFLGPEWARSLGDGIKSAIVNRLGGGKGG